MLSTTGIVEETFSILKIIMIFARSRESQNKLTAVIDVNYLKRPHKK